MSTTDKDILLKNASKDQLLAALEDYVKRTSPGDATKFTFEITGGGSVSFITTTGEGYLIKRGINMKNLRGQWIAPGGEA